MGAWIACGADFIPADVVRWKEVVYDGPFGRNGQRARRGKPVRIGEREVIAEVLTAPDAKDFISLLVRACCILSARDDVPVAPKPLEIGKEVKRQSKTLVKGYIERLRWSDESARCAIVASFPRATSSVEMPIKMSKETIYQMYARLGGAGFFVKRDSWSHPQAAAKIVSIGGLTSGELPGKPPYHNQGGKLGSPKVIAEISYRGEPPQTQELRSPGTYAYASIPKPEWWS